MDWLFVNKERSQPHINWKCLTINKESWIDGEMTHVKLILNNCYCKVTSVFILINISFIRFSGIILQPFCEVSTGGLRRPSLTTMKHTDTFIYIRVFTKSGMQQRQRCLLMCIYPWKSCHSAYRTQWVNIYLGVMLQNAGKQTCCVICSLNVKTECIKMFTALMKWW